jgi:hypothetical protein
MPEPLICNSCRHFHPAPRDPLNLTAPRVGDCRALPPQLLPVPQRGGMGAMAFYPVLEESTLACGLHSESKDKVELC